MLRTHHRPRRTSRSTLRQEPWWSSQKVRLGSAQYASAPLATTARGSGCRDQADVISQSKSRPKSDHPLVQFRVLGSLAAVRAGKPIPLGGSKQRLILALLILEANRVVSA